jgi:hypothetical protein
VTAEQIERLRRNEGRVIKITCTDGELLEAKISHVDDEHYDVVYDLVSTPLPRNIRKELPLLMSFAGMTSWSSSNSCHEASTVPGAPSFAKQRVGLLGSAIIRVHAGSKDTFDLQEAHRPS